MRRSLLTVLVAAVVMPGAADALTGLWVAVSAPSPAAAVHAAADALRTAVSLWLAVTVLSWSDEPRRGRLLLYDWRALPTGGTASHERAAHSSPRGRAP